MYFRLLLLWDIDFMNTLFFSRLAFISAICCSSLAYAANADPLLGKWKTLDYRTGFSLSDVVMSKDKQGAYAATIIELRAVPGAPRLENCTLCTGKNKDKPLLGFVPLSHLKATPSNQIEFYEGDYLDPRTGKQYKTRARLSSNGKHLTLYNVDLATNASRKMTWVKY